MALPRKYRTTSQLEFNFQRHLEREFINNGFYFTVASGFIATNGQRGDVLKRVDGRTYESFTDNWISATDATGSPGLEIINTSGVFIDGTFHLRGSGPHIPVIDYENGRVLFEGTEVSNTAVVSAEFSYSQIDVDFPNEEITNLLFSDIKDNVDFTPNAFPSGNQRQLPLVVIDLQTSINLPGELGGNKNRNQLITFHVLSTDRHELNSITDFLHETQARKTIRGVDFNLAPQQFNTNGDRASTYKNYTELQASGTLAWRRIYIDESRIRERVFDFKLLRSRVDLTINLLFLPPDGG